jgi:hypothetical protein
VIIYINLGVSWCFSVFVANIILATPHAAEALAEVQRHQNTKFHKNKDRNMLIFKYISLNLFICFQPLIRMNYKFIRVWSFESEWPMDTANVSIFDK